MEESAEHQPHAPWNKSVIVGQKSAFKRKEIGTIRIQRQLQSRVRKIAKFDLGLDSKLWTHDLVKMRMHDICQGDDGWPHATVMQ